jgi:hypothetical protein
MMSKLLITGFISFLGWSVCTLNVYAHPGWGIAVDRLGQVYFTDLKSVWKIDSRGKLSLFRESKDSHTHELNVDEDGNLYGAENSYDPATKRFFGGIWKKTTAGEFSYVVPLTDNISNGTSIWHDREGSTYHVAIYQDRELLVFKRLSNGIIKILAGSQKAARQYRQGVPYSVGGMAFGPDGSLYFVHGASISKLSAAGVLSGLVSNLRIESPSTDRANPITPTNLFGLTVDEFGNVFAADYGNRRVLEIASNGNLSPVETAVGSWLPTGVAAKGGSLYVLENEETPQHEQVRTRVRRIAPDGSTAVLAIVGGGSPPVDAAPSNMMVVDPKDAAANSSTYTFTSASATIVVSCLLAVLATLGLIRLSRVTR